MTRIRFLFLSIAVAFGLFLIGSGCDELITETIEVPIEHHPLAEFIYTPDSGCIPLEVTFDDASRGPIVKWIWNFGDSVRDTLYLDSGDINGDIIHTYTKIGTYVVTLTVFDNSGGSDPESKKRAVIIGHNIDSIAISDLLVCPGDSITFEAFNPAGVSVWRWDFGDGTILTDSGLIQTHAYDNPGLYEFNLTVTGECGQTELVDTVHVLRCAQPLFSAEPDEGCEPLTVIFIDTTDPAVIDTTTGDTVGVVVNWLWDFGNGTTQEYQLATDSIEVEYSTADNYEVTLTVTTDSGGVTTFTDTIVVHPADANFSVIPTSSCQVEGRQFVVKFTRESAGDTAWHWNFGDGYSSDAQSPYHAYTTPGSYDVSLTVYGACGADSTTMGLNDLVVYSDQLGDVIGFTVTPDPIPDSVFSFMFTDTSPAAAVLNREWDFGDESSNPTGAIATHRFGDTGIYAVTLTRWNGCDTLTKVETITIDTSGSR